jgi:hypothetical protein
MIYNSLLKETHFLWHDGASILQNQEFLCLEHVSLQEKDRPQEEAIPSAVSQKRKKGSALKLRAVQIDDSIRTSKTSAYGFPKKSDLLPCVFQQLLSEPLIRKGSARLFELCAKKALKFNF